MSSAIIDDSVHLRVIGYSEVPETRVSELSREIVDRMDVACRAIAAEYERHPEIRYVGVV